MGSGCSTLKANADGIETTNTHSILTITYQNDPRTDDEGGGHAFMVVRFNANVPNKITFISLATVGYARRNYCCVSLPLPDNPIFDLSEMQAAGKETWKDHAVLLFLRLGYTLTPKEVVTLFEQLLKKSSVIHSDFTSTCQQVKYKESEMCCNRYIRDAIISELQTISDNTACAIDTFLYTKNKVIHQEATPVVQLRESLRGWSNGKGIKA